MPAGFIQSIVFGKQERQSPAGSARLTAIQARQNGFSAS
jgi:hypothetical protein